MADEKVPELGQTAAKLETAADEAAAKTKTVETTAERFLRQRDEQLARGNVLERAAQGFLQGMGSSYGGGPAPTGGPTTQQVTFKGTPEVAYDITRPGPKEELTRLPRLDKVPDLKLSFSKIQTSLGPDVDRILQKSQQEIVGAITQTYNVLKDSVYGIQKSLMVTDKNIRVVDTRQRHFQRDTEKMMENLKQQLGRLSGPKAPEQTFMRFPGPPEKKVDDATKAPAGGGFDLSDAFLTGWFVKKFMPFLGAGAGVAAVAAMFGGWWYAWKEMEKAGGAAAWMDQAKSPEQRTARSIVAKTDYSKIFDKLQAGQALSSNDKKILGVIAGGLGLTGSLVSSLGLGAAGTAAAGGAAAVGTGAALSAAQVSGIAAAAGVSPLIMAGALAAGGIAVAGYAGVQGYSQYQRTGKVSGGVGGTIGAGLGVLGGAQGMQAGGYAGAQIGTAAQRAWDWVTGGGEATKTTPDKASVEQTSINLTAKESILLKGAKEVNLRAPRITIEAGEIIFKGKVSGLPGPAPQGVPGPARYVPEAQEQFWPGGGYGPGGIGGLGRAYEQAVYRGAPQVGGARAAIRYPQLGAGTMAGFGQMVGGRPAVGGARAALSFPQMSGGTRAALGQMVGGGRAPTGGTAPAGGTGRGIGGGVGGAMGFPSGYGRPPGGLRAGVYQQPFVPTAPGEIAEYLKQQMPQDDAFARSKAGVAAVRQELLSKQPSPFFGPRAPAIPETPGLFGMIGNIAGALTGVGGALALGATLGGMFGGGAGGGGVGRGGGGGGGGGGAEAAAPPPPTLDPGQQQALDNLLKTGSVDINDPNYAWLKQLPVDELAKLGITRTKEETAKTGASGQPVAGETKEVFKYTPPTLSTEEAKKRILEESGKAAGAAGNRKVSGETLDNIVSRLMAGDSKIGLKGMTKAEATVMAANFYQEGGFSMKAVGDPNVPGGSHGLAQWNRGRYAQLKQKSGEWGLDYTTHDAQVKFALWEMQKGGYQGFWQKYQEAVARGDTMGAYQLVRDKYEVGIKVPSAFKEGMRLLESQKAMPTRQPGEVTDTEIAAYQKQYQENFGKTITTEVAKLAIAKGVTQPQTVSGAKTASVVALGPEGVKQQDAKGYIQGLNPRGASISQLDPRAAHMTAEAMRLFNEKYKGQYRVEMFGPAGGVRPEKKGSGSEHRGEHTATDIVIIDEKSGKQLRNFGEKTYAGQSGTIGQTAPLYQDYFNLYYRATAKSYPGQEKNLRFGGYGEWSGNMMDLMHVDFGGERRKTMGGGSATEGFSPAVLKKYGITENVPINRETLQQEIATLYSEKKTEVAGGAPTPVDLRVKPGETQVASTAPVHVPETPSATPAGPRDDISIQKGEPGYDVKPVTPAIPGGTPRLDAAAKQPHEKVPELPPTTPATPAPAGDEARRAAGAYPGAQPKAATPAAAAPRVPVLTPSQRADLTPGTVGEGPLKQTPTKPPPKAGEKKESVVRKKDSGDRQSEQGKPKETAQAPKVSHKAASEDRPSTGGDRGSGGGGGGSSPDRCHFCDMP